MKIIFQTKEESNAMQEKEFLELSGAERLLQFISLSNTILKLPRKHKVTDINNNFILDKSK